MDAFMHLLGIWMLGGLATGCLVGFMRPARDR